MRDRGVLQGRLDQFVHCRQVGDEAAELGLALVLHEQVSTTLATPEGRGLDAGRDHGRHDGGSLAARVREVSRSALLGMGCKANPGIESVSDISIVRLFCLDSLP